MKDDEILKTAFKMYFNEQHPYNPKAEEKLSWEFTPQYHFEDKMNRLISNQKHFYWKYINTIGKQVAIVFIVFTVIFSTAMTVDAFRGPVVEFIISTYEQFSSRLVDRNSAKQSGEMLNETIEQELAPQKIPNGFHLSENYDDEFSHVLMWTNGKNDYIEFYQLTVYSMMNINTENVDLHKGYINDLIVYYYTQNNVISYVWYKDGYAFSLNAPDYFTFEQIEEIIKSVK